MSEKRGSPDGEHGRLSGLAEDEEPPRQFIDTVFAALADWRRREICQYFLDADAATATVDELALLLAAYEPTGNGGESNRSHADIRADLEQRHLPRLTEAGVVDYDERSGTVRYWGQPTVEKWLEHALAVKRRMEAED